MQTRARSRSKKAAREALALNGEEKPKIEKPPRSILNKKKNFNAESVKTEPVTEKEQSQQRAATPTNFQQAVAQPQVKREVSAESNKNNRTGASKRGGRSRNVNNTENRNQEMTQQQQTTGDTPPSRPNSANNRKQKQQKKGKQFNDTQPLNDFFAQQQTPGKKQAQNANSPQQEQQRDARPGTKNNKSAANAIANSANQMKSILMTSSPDKKNNRGYDPNKVKKEPEEPMTSEQPTTANEQQPTVTSTPSSYFTTSSSTDVREQPAATMQNATVAPPSYFTKSAPSDGSGGYQQNSNDRYGDSYQNQRFNHQNHQHVEQQQPPVQYFGNADYFQAQTSPRSRNFDGSARQRSTSVSAGRWINAKKLEEEREQYQSNEEIREHQQMNGGFQHVPYHRSMQNLNDMARNEKPRLHGYGAAFSRKDQQEYKRRQDEERRMKQQQQNSYQQNNFVQRGNRGRGRPGFTGSAARFQHLPPKSEQTKPCYGPQLPQQYHHQIRESGEEGNQDQLQQGGGAPVPFHALGNVQFKPYHQRSQVQSQFLSNSDKLLMDKMDEEIHRDEIEWKKGKGARYGSGPHEKHRVPWHNNNQEYNNAIKRKMQDTQSPDGYPRKGSPEHLAQRRDSTSEKTDVVANEIQDKLGFNSPQKVGYELEDGECLSSRGNTQEVDEEEMGKNHPEQAVYVPPHLRKEVEAKDIAQPSVKGNKRERESVEQKSDGSRPNKTTPSRPSSRASSGDTPISVKKNKKAKSKSPVPPKFCCSDDDDESQSTASTGGRGKAKKDKKSTAMALATYDEIMTGSKELFIDSHCHLDFIYNKIVSGRAQEQEYLKLWMEKYTDTFPETFLGCIPNFIEPALFVPGNKQKFDLNWIQEQIKDDRILGASFGCHPHFVDTYNDETHSFMENICKNRLYKIVAIGECGLDLYKSTSSLEQQLKVFSTQAKLAHEYSLPVIIHCRSGKNGDAEGPCLEVLSQTLSRFHTIHRHCFTENWMVAERWMDAFPNVYFGFTAGIDANRNAVVDEVLQKIPLNKVLLETDAPFFKPLQFDHIYSGGSRISLPGMAVSVAHAIAKAKKIPVDEVIRASRMNTITMYGLNRDLVNKVLESKE